LWNQDKFANFLRVETKTIQNKDAKNIVMSCDQILIWKPGIYPSEKIFQQPSKNLKNPQKLTRITHRMVSTVSQQVADAAVRAQHQQDCDHQHNNEHEQNQEDLERELVVVEKKEKTWALKCGSNQRGFSVLMA
jgi:hypothetical protein